MKIFTVYNGEYFAKILYDNFGWCIGTEYEELLDDEDILLNLLSRKNYMRLKRYGSKVGFCLMRW